MLYLLLPLVDMFAVVSGDVGDDTHTVCHPLVPPTTQATPVLFFTPPHTASTFLTEKIDTAVPVWSGADDDYCAGPCVSGCTSEEFARAAQVTLAPHGKRHTEPSSLASITVCISRCWTLCALYCSNTHTPYSTAPRRAPGASPTGSPKLPQAVTGSKSVIARYW